MLLRDVRLSVRLLRAVMSACLIIPVISSTGLHLHPTQHWLQPSLLLADVLLPDHIMHHRPFKDSCLHPAVSRLRPLAFSPKTLSLSFQPPDSLFEIPVVRLRP